MKACSTWALAAFAVFELACSAASKSEQKRGGVSADGAHAGASAAPSDGDSTGSQAANSNPSSPVLAAPTAPAAGGDGGMAADECGRQRFDVERKPTDVLLVLDRSGSMKEQPDGADDDAPSKWELVVPAIKEAISATDSALSWGLKFFPEGDDAGECSEDSYPGTIAVPVAPMNANKVNQAIDASMPKGDGTPTGDAMNEAVKYLQGLDDKNSKYILLATDGEPSCAGIKKKDGDDARTAAREAVESAAGSGFDTFVVGISTTKKSASTTLTELAAAGKQAPSSGYYLANTQDELVAALKAITSAAASCRFPLSSKPPVPDHVGVLIGADRVSKDTKHKDGWDYVDADYSAVELFGSSCDTVKNKGADAVSVVFGCKSDELF